MTGPSFQMKALSIALKVGNSIGASGLTEKKRAQFDRNCKVVGGSTSGSIVEEMQVGEVKVDIVHQRAAGEKALPSAGFPAAKKWVLYIHGGGFRTGSPVSHRGLCFRICQAVGQDCNIMVPEYRLAPEHPYPAGLDDVMACYEYLLAQGVAAASIVVAGDSAGGNLTLALALRLKDEGKPLPKALVLLSAFLDMSCSLESYTTKAKEDPLITMAYIKETVRLYAGDTSIDQPYLSPLKGNLSGLPPMLVQYGTAELLYSDSVELGKKVKEAGGSIELQEYPGAVHDWQVFAFLPEAHKAVKDIGAFINAQLGN